MPAWQILVMSLHRSLWTPTDALHPACYTTGVIIIHSFIVAIGAIGAHDKR